MTTLTKTLFLGIDTNNTAAATNSMFNMKGGLYNTEEIKMNFRLNIKRPFLAAGAAAATLHNHKLRVICKQLLLKTKEPSTHQINHQGGLWGASSFRRNI